MSTTTVPFSRRAFVKGVAGAAIAGVARASGASEADARRRAIAETLAANPGRASDDANILFIMSDQHRGDYLTGRGVQPELRTPNMDMLADHGVSYTRSYTACPLCVPARAAYLTGKYPSALRYLDDAGRASNWRRARVLDGEYTIPMHLARHGYYTGHIGKGHLRGETPDHLFGFHERAMGFVTDNDDYRAATSEQIAVEYWQNGTGHYGGGKEAYNSEYRSSHIDYAAHFDTLTVDRALDFLHRHRDRKWYLQIGIEKPHPTLYPPRRFMEQVNPSNVRLPDNWDRVLEDNVPERKRQRQREQMNYSIQELHRDPSTGEWAPRDRPGTRGWSERDVRNALAAYIASVNYIDHEIGRLLQGLRREGLLDKTLVVYTSDHGDMCLDHGMVQKHCCFEGAINVPMIFCGPGVQPQGAVGEGLVEWNDLFPTYCGYLGIERPDGLCGEDLTRAITQGELPQKPIACVEYYWDLVGADHEGWECAAVSERWKYIDNGRFPDELYDLADDPGENRNLAQQTEHRATVEQIRQALRARRAACGLSNDLL